MSPRARRHGLVIRELPSETLVYDLDRHKAHCLNRTAAFVWRSCDGRATVAQIAERLRKELDVDAGEEVVWLALQHLDKARLLDGPVTWPSRPRGWSRRELARRVGLVGGLSIFLPLVTTLVVPTAAQVATCRPDSPGCLVNGTPCVTSLSCCSCCCRRSGASQVCASSGQGCLTP